MFPAVARIFVSSTWIDLQPERRAVEDAIHRMSEAKFIGMEYFGSRPDSTEEASLDEVDRAEIYLGIIGGRYGSGITEAEYRRARERNLPCFIYYKDDSTIPENFRDPEPEKSARLAALKEELYARHIISAPFKSPQDLAAQVRDDLHRWFFDTHLSSLLARQAAGNITAPRENKSAVRLESGSPYGSVLRAGIQPAINARAIPLHPNVRPFRNLLDRTDESVVALQTLRQRLPVQFYGEDGTGKTALLRHLSHQDLTGDFTDGVIFHHQVGRQTASDLQQFLFDSFYESEPNYRPSEAERLNLFREKRALIVMDDVECGRAEIEDLLNIFPESAFLFAGRERALFGEGRALQMQGLPEDEARQFLERELGRTLTAAEQAPARAVCASLNGHPLSIAQAAAYAVEHNVSLADLAQRVGPGPATSLTQETADRLPDEEKRILAILSALGGTPLQAENLEQISGLRETERALESLARRNLAELTAFGWRVSGLVKELPKADGESQNWRQRIIGHFSGWIERNARDSTKIENAAPALLTCIDWAEAAELPREAIKIGRGLETSLESSGRWDASLSVLRSINRHASSIGDEETLAWTLHQEGTLAICKGEDELGRRLLTDALHRRIEMGDHIAASVTRHNLDFLLPPVIPPSIKEPAPSKQAETGRTASRLPGWAKFGLIALLSGGALLGGKAIVDRFTADDSPPLTFRPEALDFGRQIAGTQSQPQEIELINASDREIEILDVRVDGVDSERFPVVENRCFGARLRPGASCSIVIAYLPDAPAVHTARLQIRGDNAIDPGALPLRGETFAEVAVEPTPETTPTEEPTPTLEPTPAQEPTPFLRPTPSREPTPFLRPTPSREPTPFLRPTPERPAPGRPRLQFRPDELNFGQIRIRESVDRRILIINEGDGPLQIGRVNLTGADSDRFAIIENNCIGSTVAPGRNCSIGLRFAPRQAGSNSATLVILNNSDGRDERIQLQGSGVMPDNNRQPTPQQLEPRPKLDVRPANLNFPDQPVGASSQATPVRLINSGNVEITFRGIRISGSDDNDFILKNDCSRTLLPNRACLINVVFSPKNEGRRTAWIEIESNAEDSRLRVALAGTGLSTRREPAGWCCLNGKVSPMERNACIERKGAYYDDQRTATLRCRPIETRPTDRQPPPAPKPRGPGSAFERRPATISNCEKTIISWGEVTDPSSPVSYAVQIQARPIDSKTAGGWREVLSTKTGRTSQQAFADRSRVSSKLIYRWAVRATDAAGNSSEFSPFLHFTCGSDIR